MTDARMPERWLMDRRIIRLPHVAFRAYVTSMMWSVSNRTDGIVLRDDLTLIPTFETIAVALLVEAGLWEPCENGWRIIDYQATQTSKHELEVLENVRRAGREKKARQRSRKSEGVSFEEGPEDVPGDVPGDVSPRTAQARQGKEVVTWNVVEIPGSKKDVA